MRNEVESLPEKQRITNFDTGEGKSNSIPRLVLKEAPDTGK